MSDISYSWQVRVIGCGQCGGRIAAIFDKKPSFLPRRTEDLYPVRCAVIDTDRSVIDELQSNWGWHSVEDIHILPVASSSTLASRILAGSDITDSETRRVMENRIESSKGIGGFPYLGRVSAEEFLLTDSSARSDFKDSLVERGFNRGGLLTVNSLSGGTGTGFSQVVSNFLLSEFFGASMNLNLSIIPEGTHLPQAYPSTMLYCLYHLLNDERIDGIILADNDVLQSKYGCKGNYDYNSFLHELLAPIFLAPSGKFSVSDFGAVLDGADIRRALRPTMAVDLPELCALAFAVKPLPSSFTLTLRSSQARQKHLQEFLNQLVEQACASTTTGEPAKAKSGLALLCGPPSFFQNTLDNNSKYFTYLWELLMRKISPQFRLAALEFEDMKKVHLVMLLSGTSSVKLTRIFEGVLLPHGGLPVEETLGESIRKLDKDIVEELMTGEIRKHLLA